MLINDNNLIIYGCGGHSRSVASVLLHNNSDVNIIFVDSEAKLEEKIFGFDVVKNSDENKLFHIALGHNLKRKSILDTSDIEKLVTISSNTAVISSNSFIEKGCFIANLVYVGPFCKIGISSIINTRATIEHEVQIGNFCHIAPSSTICGRTTIGDNVFIGATATVLDKINICSNVIVGANATVTKNIDEPGTYLGTPAKRVK